MSASRLFRVALLTVAILASGALALAQDYSVSSVSGKWVSPPSSGTNDLSSTLATGSYTITTVSNLPFPIPYYGRSFTTMAVASSGYVQFGANYSYPYASPGPFTSTSLSQYEGVCAAAWSYLIGNSAGSSQVRWWTDGTAPDRRLIVAWTNFGTVWSVPTSTGNTTINLQMQFNESSGRITMAYSGGGSWNLTNSSPYGYCLCLDEPGGTRFTRPANGETTGTYAYGTGGPTSDWQFDPRATTFTGTVRYDALVADGSGVGNTTQQNVPFSGLRVELRDSTGGAVGSGTTDASGNYTVKGLALVGTQVGTLAVVARSAASIVRPPYTAPTPPTAPYSFTIATGIAFNANASVGTYTITSGLDPGGTARAPLHIAHSIQAAYDKVKQYTADAIPELEVIYSNSGTEPTNYIRGATPAASSMRIAGPGSSNPDGWDTGVVQHAFARHLLFSIAAAQSTGITNTFDAISDDENAFAEGFGYYIAALLSGSASYYDTVNANTATTINLEDPQPTTRPGSDVAACVAAALYDLIDGTNESWDEVDGSGAAADRPIQVVNSLTAAPTALTFYTAWGQLALPGTAGLSRAFIHNGAVADDASEANDRASEATAFAAPGFRRSNLMLNAYNEDWFQFQLSEAATGLEADVQANFTGANVNVTVELQDSVGGVLATDSTKPGSILLRAVRSSAVPAGVYRVRVRHDSGGQLPAYVVQAFPPLTMTSAGFTPWTVGRPYSLSVSAKGGVPPYTIAVEQPFVKPSGLILDSVNLRIAGSPQEVKVHSFSLTLKDDGDPVNKAAIPQTFVVNDVLDIRLGGFIGFPLGRAVDQRVPFTGGTAPMQFTLTSGSAPSGLNLDVATLRFQGTPDLAGGTAFHLDGVDLAGSTDSAATVAVVAVPLPAKATPVDLAAGDSACGYYFDAVHGSVVSFAATTAKKRLKRTLRLVVLDPAGNAMSGLAIKAGVGKATVSGIQCDLSGRYYVILASADGDATQLLGTVKLAPPKKASGKVTDFGPGNTLDVKIGAVAGAHVVLTCKPDKSGLKLRGNVLRDPSGAVVQLQTGDVVDSGNGIVFSKDLPVGGTWTFTVSALPGLRGNFAWSLKITQPKGVTYSAD